MPRNKKRKGRGPTPPKEYRPGRKAVIRRYDPGAKPFPANHVKRNYEAMVNADRGRHHRGAGG